MSEMPNTNRFDITVHAAGTIKWLEAGDEDPRHWQDRLSQIAAQQEYIPLAQFAEVYQRPDTSELDERHRSALGFLAAQGVSAGLLAELGGEIEESKLKLDAGKAHLRAVLRAEALARGEYDPWPFVFFGEIKRAIDY